MSYSNENHEQTKPGEELGTEIVTEVEEIRDAVDQAVTETALPDKVDDLMTSLNNISEEVDGWRYWHKNTFLEIIESLKSQVEDVHQEWTTVSEGLSQQKDKFESLINNFPGAIEA